MPKIKFHVTVHPTLSIGSTPRPSVQTQDDPKPGETWLVRFVHHEPGHRLEARKIYDIKPDYVIFDKSFVLFGNHAHVHRDLIAYDRADVTFYDKVQN